MRKIFLHIGASKTASSAIQKFLQINRPILRENGYFLPDQHLGFGRDITGFHVFTIQKIKEAQDSALLTQRIRELDTTLPVDQAIIISAENIADPGVLDLMMGDTFDGFDVTIVLYIRRQDEYLASAWQQWHSKAEPDFMAWVIQGMQRFGHWDKVIQNCEKITSRDKIKVRLFEKWALIGQDILTDFLDAIELPADTPGLDFNIGTVNPSFTDMITPLVTNNPQIAEGGHDNGFYNFVREMTGDTYCSGGKKVSLMNRHQRRAVFQFYLKSNEWVRENYFPDQTGLFSPIDDSKYEYLDQDDLRDRQMRFLTHLVYETYRSQTASESKADKESSGS